MRTGMLMAAGVAAALVAGAAAADPVAGLWQTQPGDTGAFAHVRIAPCGTAVCGTFEQAFDGAGRRVASDAAGRAMIWDMTADGGGRYGGGKIWAPDRDKTYAGKMELTAPDRLNVAGCVLGICRSQVWARVE